MTKKAPPVDLIGPSEMEMSRRNLLMALPLTGSVNALSTPARAQTQAKYANNTPADQATYTPAARGALPSTVSDKLNQFALSVMDFMTPAQAASIRSRSCDVDCTDAMNAAFLEAQRTGRTVFMPDGHYLVGNLLFGAQSTTGQSPAPPGLQGQSKTGTVLRARPGLKGTLLQSWTLAGATFSDFSIETLGTGALAWDCQWKAGDGPSTQNIIRNIMVTGGSAPLHVNWDHLNDTFPIDVTVRVDDKTSASCGISMVQSGGLSLLRGCIWSYCYLRFGAQNAKIDGCWGHGIEFAFGCMNHVEISAGYMYSNPTYDAVFWSQSYADFQSVRSMVCTATQFLTEGALENAPKAKVVSCYFNLNAYSILKFSGCQWFGKTAKLLGSKSRADSYAPVLVKIEGGTHSGSLVLEDVTGFEIECEGLMSFATGRMVTKNRGGTFTPILRDAGSKAGDYTTGGSTFGRYERSGNVIRFKLRVEWSRTTASGAEGIMELVGLPLEYDPDGVDGVTLEYAGPTFSGKDMRPTIGKGVITFNALDGSAMAMPKSGELVISGSYGVKA